LPRLQLRRPLMRNCRSRGQGSRKVGSTQSVTQDTWMRREYQICCSAEWQPRPRKTGPLLTLSRLNYKLSVKRTKSKHGRKWKTNTQPKQKSHATRWSFINAHLLYWNMVSMLHAGLICYIRGFTYLFWRDFFFHNLVVHSSLLLTTLSVQPHPLVGYSLHALHSHACAMCVDGWHEHSAPLCSNQL